MTEHIGGTPERARAIERAQYGDKVQEADAVRRGAVWEAQWARDGAHAVGVAAGVLYDRNHPGDLVKQPGDSVPVAQTDVPDHLEIRLGPLFTKDILAFDHPQIAHATDSIVSLIVAGALKPGEMSSDKKIAEQLGTRRRPVQYALALLTRNAVVSQAAEIGVWPRQIIQHEALQELEQRHEVERSVFECLTDVDAKPDMGHAREVATALRNWQWVEEADPVINADRLLNLEGRLHTELARAADSYIGGHLIAGESRILRVHIATERGLSRRESLAVQQENHDLFRHVVKGDLRSPGLLEEYFHRWEGRLQTRPDSWHY